ncbi:transposase [Lactobacillaceae bacterium 24-114]
MGINRYTFQRNLSSILNACNYPQYSNGRLEGIIHKIKQIQRTAYVFRNFHNLLVRIKLQQTSLNKKDPSIIA